MQRVLFLSLFAALLLPAPALACRGTAEYPAVEQELAMSNLPAERKEQLMNELLEGKALHDAGHQQNDQGKMKESLQILDRIKQQLE